MKEINEIVAAYKLAVEQGHQTALATVVHLQGSAYRRPGARMLVTDEGQLTGAISGGCLEGDALRKAQMAMLHKKPMLVTYDTTDDEDNVLGVGLGCNGIISILIEPLDAADAMNPVVLLEGFAAQRQWACMVTLFNLDKKAAQPGTCLLLKEDTTFQTRFANNLNADLQTAAAHVIAARKSAFRQYAGGVTAFFEILEPPVSLLVFGAGNDVIPLVQMANVLGWQTTVTDGRSSYANRRRFPLADHVVMAKPANALTNITTDARTVAVLMTHNYRYDIEILEQLIDTSVGYIGVLGPKKKMNKMLEELSAKAWTC